MPVFLPVRVSALLPGFRFYGQVEIQITAGKTSDLDSASTFRFGFQILLRFGFGFRKVTLFFAKGLHAAHFV